MPHNIQAIANSFITLINFPNCSEKLDFPSIFLNLYTKSLPSVVRDLNALPILSRNSPMVESFKRSLNTNLRETSFFFYVGDRPGQIHHARLRTNCSALNYYQSHKNIIEDPRCTCRLPKTNKQFLLECRKYNAIRTDMMHEDGSSANQHYIPYCSETWL